MVFSSDFLICRLDVGKSTASIRKTKLSANNDRLNFSCQAQKKRARGAYISDGLRSRAQRQKRAGQLRFNRSVAGENSRGLGGAGDATGPRFSTRPAHGEAKQCGLFPGRWRCGRCESVL